MARKKATKKRGTTKTNYAASRKSKTKNTSVTKKFHQTAEEKSLIQKLRNIRRAEEKRAKEREYKRRVRATMDASELLKIRKRDALRKRQYRSNLSMEKLMLIRQQDKFRKRNERAERANVSETDLADLKSMDDNKDQEENIAGELLVALRPKKGTDAESTTTTKRGRKIKKTVKFT